MSYRIGFAGLGLESVTRVRQITGTADFERLCYYGDELTKAHRGTNSVPGGCLNICEAEGAEFVPVLYTLGGAVGPASDESIAVFTQRIVEGLRDSGPLDGIVMFLHGACWAAGYPDVEKFVIDNVRAAFPDTPFAVALDYHGNVDAASFAGADIVVAYRHSPHIDVGETGERATRALIRMLREGHRPGLAVVRPGIVIPSILSATTLEPLASIIAEARAIEAAADCDISIMAGFAYADSPNTGMAVVCVDWHGQAAAEEKAHRLAARLHAARREISSSIKVHSVASAMADLEAGPARGKPVILLEHADRMNDSTHVLKALLGRDVGRVAVPFLYDPQTAEAAIAAGMGAEIPLRIGGKTSPETGGPVEAVARVLWCGPKTFTVSGRMYNGTLRDLGPTAYLEIGKIRISVVSHFSFAVDGDPFYIFGEKPDDYDVILLRSKTHFRDFYEPIADRILVIDTPDLGPADVTRIPYDQLDTRGVFPWCDAPPFE